MRHVVPGLIVGFLFGAGLTLSGMVDPARVLGFLDLAGAWDPTLAFVLAAALAPSVLAYVIVRRMKRPLLAEEFCIPAEPRTRTAAAGRCGAVRDRLGAHRPLPRPGDCRTGPRPLAELAVRRSDDRRHVAAPALCRDRRDERRFRLQGHRNDRDKDADRPSFGGALRAAGGADGACRSVQDDRQQPPRRRGAGAGDARPRSRPRRASSASTTCTSPSSRRRLATGHVRAFGDALTRSPGRCSRSAARARARRCCGRCRRRERCSTDENLQRRDERRLRPKCASTAARGASGKRNDTLEPIQYLLGGFSGALVGFVLGLVGGGGSILAVPLMVYLVGVRSPHLAIGTSALAVAANAALGLFTHARHGNVKWRCSLVFAAFRHGGSTDRVDVRAKRSTGKSCSFCSRW